MVNGRSISGDIELNDTKVEGALKSRDHQRHGAASPPHRPQPDGQLGERQRGHGGCHGGPGGAQSISGDITYGGDLRPNGNYELTSHSGNVRCPVPASTGFQIEATSFSGSISTDIPVTMSGRAKTAAPRSCSLRGDRRRRRGLPRPHHLLGLNHHRQALAGGTVARGPPTTCRCWNFPTVTAWRATRLGADCQQILGNHQGRAAGGAGTLVAQVP